ncbi:hypothetical protein GCM10027020_34900 [Nocardioides salsibiostraticola]
MSDAMKAVVGEDDPDVRVLIELVLQQSGFEVILAENGLEAIEAVREHKPVLTTMDVNMPGLDGFAVVKRIREFSHTYLIMITALTEEVDVIRGFEAGADDYLIKPFRPRELRARADSMLRRASYGVGASGGPATDRPAAVPQPDPESWAAAASRELIADGTMPLRTPAAQPLVADQAPQAQAQAQAPAPLRAVEPSSPVRAPAPQEGTDSDFIRFAALTVELASGRVSFEGRSLELTQVEADLLISLLRSGRRVRSKADLVLVMRGEQFVTSHFVNEADKREVERHVLGLMRKLGDDGPATRYIEVVRGVGYRMADNAI